MKCRTCHHELKTHEDYCPVCGTRIFNSSSHSDMEKIYPNRPYCLKRRRKSRYVVILLAVFTGFLGGHRFYLGRRRDVVLGIVYLLFSFTCIPLCISLCEAIYFYYADNDTFDMKYNYDSDPREFWAHMNKNGE